MSIEHVANERWPWSFRATQHLSLVDNTLNMVSSVTNLAALPAPLAFGHHPYFERKGAFLKFSAASVLINGEDDLPVNEAPISGAFDFGTGAHVADRIIDHCYAGWDGRATISWDGRRLALDIASDLKAAVVFVPRDEDSFCFEPVPHVTNALNRTDLAPGLPTIEPGAHFTSKVAMRAV